MKERNASDPDEVYRAYAPPSPVEEEPAPETSQSDEAPPRLDAVQWAVVALFFGCMAAALAWAVFIVVSVVTGNLP